MGNSETVMSGSTLDDWMHIDDTPGTREEFGNPESWDWIVKNGDTDTSAMAAQKGGNLTEMSNFLATDKVPDTIFGIPIVSRREDYTDVDIAFFKEHPEAGGYYDMGDEPVQDGTEEGAPVQDDMPSGKAKPSTVTDEELFVRGRKFINKTQGDDRVQLLRRGGFSDVLL